MNIIVERKDGIGRVTLNRPEVRNAFDDALIATLAKAFAELDADSSVRVVVLAGNGPAFCAGADLNWMKRMAGYSYDQNLRDARALADMLAALDRLDKPTIARVHGPAFAGGTGLVTACDIAVGTPEAKFCFSEAKYHRSSGSRPRPSAPMCCAPSGRARRAAISSAPRYSTPPRRCASGCSPP